MNYFLIVILLKTYSVLSQSENDVTMEEAEAMSMLKKYNYLGEGSPDPGMHNDSMYSQALMMFQEVAGLKETGELDMPTMMKMKSPRCGVPDFMRKADMMRRRRKRYATTGSKWSEGRVGYNYVSYPTGSTLSHSVVQGYIDKAFEAWADVAKLHFTKVNTKSDIQISFVSGDHGDGYPLDGPGGTLAHAFFPAQTELAGDMHFDDTETWSIEGQSVNGKTGIDLYFVALHELGHSLGLQHSMNEGAVMYPYYPGYKADLKLTQDDIDGMVYIYGSNEKTTRPTQPPPTQRPATMPPKYQPFCDAGTLDAIGTLGGRLFAFQGSMYAELGEQGVLPDYPRRIQDDWQSLEDNFDAALALEEHGILLLFKGYRYWRYSLVNGRPQLNTNYPRDIADDFTGGVPDQFNAAFTWSGNGRRYIIHGDNYYRLRTNIKVTSDKIEAKCDRWYYNYPKSFSKEWGIGQPITNAFMYHERTFFCSTKDYYRYNDNTYTVDNGYPMPIAPHWFGCKPPGSLQSPEMEMDMMATNDQFKEIHSILPISEGCLQKANIFSIMLVICLCISFQ